MGETSDSSLDWARNQKKRISRHGDPARVRLCSTVVGYALATGKMVRGQRDRANGIQLPERHDVVAVVSLRLKNRRQVRANPVQTSSSETSEATPATS